ncbi:MAG: hypothetical protein ACODAC_11845 [Pseudomonadota bacterium]
MKVSKLWIFLGTLTMSLGVAAATTALEENQIRGELVDVDAEANELRIRVEDAGDGERARVDRTETFAVDPDAEVRAYTGRRSLTDPTVTGIDDLEAGMQVTLRIGDVEGQSVAQELEVRDEPEQTAQAEDTTEQTEAAAMESGERSALPATASMLPLMALGGLGFAAAALILRAVRRRR